MKPNRIGSACLFSLAAAVALSAGSSNAAPRAETAGPFGVQLGIPPDELPQNLDEAVKIGASWVRLTGPTGANWTRIEPSPGRYQWAELDRAVDAAARRGLKVLVTIESGNPVYRSKQGHLPNDMLAHARFLTRLVERYDGDGTDDAPGSPVVDAWQIENEVDIRQYWPDSMANYAELLRASSKTIKQANPGAKVALAGMMDPAGLSKYAQIMRHLDDGRYFDIFDLHWNCRAGGNYRLQLARNMGHIPFDKYLREARCMLDAGSNREAEIWITETSTSDSANPFDNERTQAADLVRRLVYSLRSGVPVVLWRHVRDYPWNDQPDNYFSRAGLIHQKGDKKLAYYSYALLAEKLAGCDASDVEIVKETETVRVYKCTRRGTNGNSPVWVLWNDGLGATTYSLEVGPVKRARITEAVARVGIQRGADIRNPAEAFNTTVAPSRGGKVNVKLPLAVPVYVERAE